MKSRRRFVKWLALLAATSALVFAGRAWQRRSRPEQQFREALLALKEGNSAIVTQTVKSLKGRPGFESHVHVLQGGLLLRAGAYVASIQELSLAKPEGDVREPALLFTGKCFYRLERLAEAQLVMQQLVQERPKLAPARRWLGAIYYDLGANELAIAELKVLIALEPDDFAPHRLIGLMRHDFEQSSLAIIHYRKALALSPPANVEEAIRRELAESLIHERDYAAALLVLEKARPDAQLLVLRSECYWSLGRRDRADQTLKQARMLDPVHRDLLLLESRLQIDDGDLEQATVPLKLALESDPHDHECRYQLAQIYQRLGRSEDYEVEIVRWEVSKKLFEQLSKLSIEVINRPRDAEIRDQIADVCNKLGKHKLAEMWKRAAEACRQTDGTRAK